MSTFDQQIEVKNTLSYCGANIWNYILNKVNPKSAIGSLKKSYPKFVLAFKWQPIHLIEDMLLHHCSINKYVFYICIYVQDADEWI